MTLRHLGRPRNALLLALHKLVSLAGLGYVGWWGYRLNQAAAPAGAAVAVQVGTLVCFLAAIATGGLLSTDRQTPGLIRTLHRLAAVLSLLGTVAVLRLLWPGAG
jgi:hypothetical protein